MKPEEYRNLRLNDPVVIKQGILVKACDIDRNARTIKVGNKNGGWRSYHEVMIPTAEQLAQAREE